MLLDLLIFSLGFLIYVHERDGMGSYCPFLILVCRVGRLALFSQWGECPFFSYLCVPFINLLNNLQISRKQPNLLICLKISQLIFFYFKVLPTESKTNQISQTTMKGMLCEDRELFPNI